MTPERIEKERSAFEAWHKETFGYLPKKYKDGTFMSPSRADEVNPQDMFEGWLANATQSKWISVEERLPETETSVLVCTERGYIFLSWASNEDVFWFYNEDEDDRVTHWQPLPEPPEEIGK